MKISPKDDELVAISREPRQPTNVGIYRLQPEDSETDLRGLLEEMLIDVVL